MLDIHALPVPDWGLACPNCAAALDGLKAHRCAACGRAFNIMTVLARHRPIPDLDMHCPNCGYSLTGLTGDRCPECGQPFSLAEMLEGMIAPELAAVMAAQFADPPDAHVPRRPPAFTGRERPLPDFGLTCAACGIQLAGAAANQCPSCRRPFDLDALVPRLDMVDISRLIPPVLAPASRSVLYEAGVPYFVQVGAFERLYGVASGHQRVVIPREYVFDALHALAEATPVVNALLHVEAQHPGSAPETGWTCPACSESVPAHFEICWNCQEPRSGGQS